MSADQHSRQAVIATIERESDAYLSRDFEAWARCWVQAPHVRRWVFHAARGIYAWQGWDLQAARIRQIMAADSLPSSAFYRRENMSVTVGADMAWVTFDQFIFGARSGQIDLPETTSEMRVLERHDGEWKIACVCNFHRTLDQVTFPLLRVEPDGMVAWRNAAASADLAAVRGIVLRAGRLHATDRSVDVRLQAAFRWAGVLDNGVWPRRGSLPIVLEGGRGEPADVCWVIARDGQILVAFNDRQMTEERLAAAVPVYGVTKSQTRLAQLIIEGHDLVAAARLLGVTVNTARTHLKRLYEKTGVHTQPSLVRALLSITSPMG